MADDNSGFDPNQFNLNDIAQKASEIQEKMKAAHDEVANLQVKGESGGGMAHVVMNGRHKIVRADVDDQTWNHESKEVILDLINSAVNDAVDKIEEQARKKMQGLSEQMGMPDMGQGGGSEQSGS
jgi:DNA-binding YbaB/EbfC family protein